MIATPQHSPKLRALEALHAGALSEVSQRRLQTHLQSCELCRTTLRGLRIHAQLTQELRRDVADFARPDFARMELALRREARAVNRVQRARRSALPIAAVAAAALLVSSWALRSRVAEPEAPLARSQPVQKPVVVPVPKASHAELTVLRGQGSVLGNDGASRALSLGASIAQGETLSMAAGSEAHLRVDDHTGFIVEAGSQVALTTLHTDAVDLLLGAGAVTSQVRKLADAERYDVHALGYTVSVRGTRFRVAIDAGKLSVAVSEGHVLVIDRAGKLVGDLTAPASFDEAHGGQAGLREALQAPRMLTLPLAAWPALSLPAWPSVRSWSLDGSNFPASAELAMRVPRGEVTLRAQLDDGRERSTQLQVPEAGLRMDERMLRRLLRVSDEAPAVAIDSTAIMRVVSQGTPALQRCYERVLKQRPEVSGRLVLRIVVDGAGRVRKVTARGDAAGVPDDLVSCIRSSAERWSFPAAGGTGMTFDAPLRLASGH